VACLPVQVTCILVGRLHKMFQRPCGMGKFLLKLSVFLIAPGFTFNHRHSNRWNRTLDVLQAAFQVDAPRAAELLGRVESAQFAEVCPVAG